jgi:rhodanese-related sulfurtransferase
MTDGYNSMLSGDFRMRWKRFRVAAGRCEKLEKLMAATPQFDLVVKPTDTALIGLSSVGDPSEDAVAILARAKARAAGLGYAGNVTPNEALELLNAGAARLIDVRTPEERKFVGYVQDSVAVPWATGTAFTRNPRFIRELEGNVRKDEVLLFLCRSGSRSILAAEAASRAQFHQAYNILEGFEGELDQQRRRGSNDGWRFRGLPWVQD